jgi:hypothetical protein
VISSRGVRKVDALKNRWKEIDILKKRERYTNKLRKVKECRE